MLERLKGLQHKSDILRPALSNNIILYLIKMLAFIERSIKIGLCINVF